LKGSVAPARPRWRGGARHFPRHLRATAIGLIAAIPAVMAYNHFQHKIRVLVKEMDSFSTEFLNIVQRNITGK